MQNATGSSVQPLQLFLSTVAFKVKKILCPSNQRIVRCISLDTLLCNNNEKQSVKSVTEVHIADTLFSIQKRPHVQLLWETDEGVKLFLVACLSGQDNRLNSCGTSNNKYI